MLKRIQWLVLEKPLIQRILRGELLRESVIYQDIAKGRRQRVGGRRERTAATLLQPFSRVLTHLSTAIFA
jgi:hypothetical protein